MIVAGVFKADEQTPMIFDSSALQLFPGASATTTAFLAQYNSEGALQWAQRFRSGEMLQTKVAVDRSDHIYFAGRVEAFIQIDTVNLVPSNTNDPFLFLIKLNNDGALIWAKIIAETEPETVPNAVNYLNLESIQIDPDGQIVLLGDFEQPSVSIGDSAIAQIGFRDVFLAKLDEEGNTQWVKGVGDSALHDFAQQMALDLKGDIYISRTFQPTDIINESIKTVIEKIDASGQRIWMDTINPGPLPNGLAFLQLHVGPGNDLYTFATYRGSFSIQNHTLPQGNHIAISKISPEGIYDWVRTTGSTSISDPTIFPEGISCDSEGAIYITGTYVEGLTGLVTDLILDTVQLINQGGRDVFFATFDQEGRVRFADNVGGLLNDAAGGLVLDRDNNAYVTGYFNSDQLAFSELIQLNPSANNNTWSTNFFLAKFGAGQPADLTEKDTAFGLRVFPNPTRSALQLQCSVPVQRVTIIDLQGRVVYKKAFTKEVRELELDIAHLTPGNYYLQVAGAVGSAVKTIALVR